MAGYSGQLVALDAETPSEEAQNAATATQSQVQAQLAQQTLPSDVALKQAQAQTQAGVAQGVDIKNQSDTLDLNQRIQLNTLRQKYLSSVGGSPAQSQLGALPTGAGQPAPPASLFDPRVQEVMQSVEPSDPNAAVKFDAGMKAIEGDVPQAAQFVGNYSKSNLQNWRSAIGANTVKEAGNGAGQLAGGPAATPTVGAQLPGTAPGGGASTAPVGISPLTGAVDPELQRMAILDPKGTQEMISMQAMLKYQQTGDPAILARYAPEMFKSLTDAQKNATEAQKTALVTQMTTMGQQANAVLALAHQLGDKTGTSPEVRAAYTQAVTNAYQHGWIDKPTAEKELAGPVDLGQLAYLAAQSQTVSEYMTSSGATAANEARAKAANPAPESVIVGYDNKGRPIYHSAHAAPGTPDTVGTVSVADSRGGGVLGGTYAEKLAALQNAGLQPQEAALVASGQHVLDPAHITVLATAAAQKDAQNASLTGQPFDEAAATAKYQQMFSGAAATPSGPGGGGAPRTAAPAPGAPTPAQNAAAQPFRGAKAPVGSPQNPYMPTSAKQYANLPNGAHYIYVDGSVRIKP